MDSTTACGAVATDEQQLRTFGWCSWMNAGARPDQIGPPRMLPSRPSRAPEEHVAGLLLARRSDVLRVARRYWRAFLRERFRGAEVATSSRRVRGPTSAVSSRDSTRARGDDAKDSWHAPARRSQPLASNALNAAASMSRRLPSSPRPQPVAAGTRSQTSSSRAASRSGSARCGGSKWWRSSNTSSV
jgi:hypothetical protein